ncbi:hypothetical protein V8C40DRAFT_233185 [Trichoderma camerunense]
MACQLDAIHGTVTNPAIQTPMVLVWLQVQHGERSTGRPIEKSRYATSHRRREQPKWETSPCSCRRV